MVRNKVTVEVQTIDDTNPVSPPIKVCSETIWGEQVTLEIGAEKVTVLGSDLKRAIDSVVTFD